MKKLTGIAVGVVTALLSSGATAATETVIYSFPRPSGPLARLEQLKSGPFHGTTSRTNGFGTVFEISQRQGVWKLKTINQFSGGNGKGPVAGVIHDPSDVLWGVTKFGGSHNLGAIYSLTPNGSNWTQNLLYSFSGTSDGKWPEGNLAQDPVTGSLYGTTSAGGSNGCGTVFQIDPNKVVSTLYTFHGGSDGCTPQVALHAGAQKGTLLGVTHKGGSWNAGTVFELTETNSTWTEAVIYSFTKGADGGFPTDMAIDKDGNVFGVASNGGSHNRGVAFEVVPVGHNWQQSVIYNFNGSSDGAAPDGLTLAANAQAIYITTRTGGSQNVGTVSKLTLNGVWQESTLHSFGAFSGDGRTPRSRVNLDPSTALIYGTTNGGGTFGGGAIYEISE